MAAEKHCTQKNLVEVFRCFSLLLIDEISDNKGQYSGTGFFISKDGKLLTNLHVVKPWLQNNGKDREMLQNEMSRFFATIVEA